MTIAVKSRNLDTGVDIACAPTYVGLGEYYKGTSRAQGLVLGYAGLSEKEINRDVQRLVTVLKQTARHHS